MLVAEHAFACVRVAWIGWPKRAGNPTTPFAISRLDSTRESELTHGRQPQDTRRARGRPSRDARDGDRLGTRGRVFDRMRCRVALAASNTNGRVTVAFSCASRLERSTNELHMLDARPRTPRSSRAGASDSGHGSRHRPSDCDGPRTPLAGTRTSVGATYIVNSK